jgi:hypothetical protein
VLPRCLSSVYFFYDPDYDFLSLGVLSALYEIDYVASQQHPMMVYYYMGFYIDTCRKMQYKAQYRPSQLLDPFHYTWVSYDQAIPWIRQRGFTLLDVSREVLEDDNTWKRHMILEQDAADRVDRSGIQSVTLWYQGSARSAGVSWLMQPFYYCHMYFFLLDLDD